MRLRWETEGFVWKFHEGFVCECNRSSFLATVFVYASAFNGDLNQWDVAKVTTVEGSKPIRIVENDLT